MHRPDSSYIDFETRSAVDLLNSNSSVYARHESTSILCCVIKRNGISKAFTDFLKQKEALLKFIEGSILVAHNAMFEQLLWKHVLVACYGYPEMPPNQWRDTMAKLLSHGLPRSLEKGGDALNLLITKDMAGKKHMLKMCKPDGPNTTEDMIKLIEYCAQDNHTAEAIDLALPDLSPEEQEVWELDQEINMRGVQIDTNLIKTIVSILDKEKEELLVKFNEATNGEVDSPTKRQALKDWLQNNGLDLPDLTAGTLAKLDTSNEMESIQSAISIRQALSKSSTAKYKRILNEVDIDGRMRCNLIYHAASTGRWGGTDAQLQNLPRPKLDVLKEIERIKAAERLWPALYGSCAEASKSLIRSVLIPRKGKKFIGGDFSGIEARVLAWIAGQTDSILSIRNGENPYCRAATGIYGRLISKANLDEYQTGKGAVLAFGYQGGIAALFKICALAGISIKAVTNILLSSATNEELDKAEFSYTSYSKPFKNEGFIDDGTRYKVGTDYWPKNIGMAADIIKQRWRKANPKIVEFWGNINVEAIEAVKKGEATINNFPNPIRPKELSWFVKGEFLYCRLPSGRKLAYYKPRVEEIVNKFGTKKETLTYLALDAKTKTLVRRAAYGGLLTENIVQAISRDIMVCAMLNCRDAEHDLVLTVHDELLLEVEPNVEKEEIEALMIKPISWCPDLPLAVGLTEGCRYGK